MRLSQPRSGSGDVFPVDFTWAFLGLLLWAVICGGVLCSNINGLLHEISGYRFFLLRSLYSGRRKVTRDTSKAVRDWVWVSRRMGMTKTPETAHLEGRSGISFWTHTAWGPVELSAGNGTSAVGYIGQSCIIETGICESLYRHLNQSGDSLRIRVDRESFQS